jgi:hypothetical protein
MWVRDYISLIEFFTIVLVCAPDRFFKEDYLEEHEQLTLDNAFDELRQGLHFATDQMKDKALVSEIRSGVETAYETYRAGKTIEGSRILQAVEALVIKNSREPR